MRTMTVGQLATTSAFSTSNLKQPLGQMLGQFLFQSQEKNMKREQSARYYISHMICTKTKPQKKVLDFIDTLTQSLSQVAGWGDTGNGYRLS